MFDRGDAYHVSILMKADAEVADAEPELGRLNVLQTFDVAFSSSQIASEHMQNMKSRRAIDREAGPGLALTK
jgi:hypothetical protein